MFKSPVPLALLSLLVALTVLAQAPAPVSPLEDGWKAYRGHDFAKALEAARVARQASPSDVGAAELWGRACLAMGEPSKAAPALNAVAAQRGTVEDLRLLALTLSLTGKAPEAELALKRAEQGKSPTPEALYALATQKPDAQGRLALLKRIAQEFPASAAALAPEIAFWEARAGAVLRAPAQPLPVDGVSVKLKTLYDMEWAVCVTASGDELWLMVDTAARQTVLSKDTAERLKLATFQSAYPVAGAYPQEAAPVCALLESLDLGGWALRSVPVIVAPDPQGVLTYREGRNVLKGILGMDLLRGMKVRFDRKDNRLLLLPPAAPSEKLLDGKPGDWRETPAFLAYDQIMVPSFLGTRNPVLGLLATGCLYTMAADAALPGSGLAADSKNAVNLSFGALSSPTAAGASAVPAPGVASASPQVIGWIEEALPPAGKVRTVPKDAAVGFAGARFVSKDLPVYPGALGSDLPAAVVVGRKITDFFALAWDPAAGKLYVKQVLFAK